MSNFARRLLLPAVAAVASAVMVVAGPVVDAAHADPTAVDQARAQLTALQEDASQIGEQYSQAQAALESERAHVATLSADIQAQQTKVDALRQQATVVALTQFRNRNVDTTLQLFTTEDPESFLNAMSTARKVDENMNLLLQEFQTEQANLSNLKRSAESEQAALVAEQARLADLSRQAQSKVDQARRLLNGLTAEQRAQVSRSSTRGLVQAPAAGSASDKALAAVNYALSKVGNSSYVWGAAGPNAFDCSGLTMAAYATVGVSLPHYTGAQYSMGMVVSRDNLIPGDLVFFYAGITHVGIYIGNGQFVHASNPLTDIIVSDLDSWPSYQGARRVA